MGSCFYLVKARSIEQNIVYGDKYEFYSKLCWPVYKACAYLIGAFNKEESETCQIKIQFVHTKINLTLFTKWLLEPFYY